VSGNALRWRAHAAPLLPGGLRRPDSHAGAALPPARVLCAAPRARARLQRHPPADGARPLSRIRAAAALHARAPPAWRPELGSFACPQEDKKKMMDVMEAVQASLTAKGKSLADVVEFSDVMCEEVEKAVKSNGLKLNAPVALGPYSGYGGGGPSPCFLHLAQFGGMQNNAKALRHMLKLGADANLRCTAYSVPNLFSVTPITHFIVSLVMTGMADGMYMDVAAAVEALLDGGADINARVNIAGQVSPGAEPPVTAHQGPEMGFTPVMMLANTAPSTSPKGVEILKLLLARGADLGAKAGDGKTTREMPMSQEAQQLINV
jgi:hypothetical protein